MRPLYSKKPITGKENRRLPNKRQTSCWSPKLSRGKWNGKIWQNRQTVAETAQTTVRSMRPNHLLQKMIPGDDMEEYLLAFLIGDAQKIIMTWTRTLQRIATG